MTVEGTVASSPEDLVVSLEQANALIDLMGTREGDSALSSAMPVSGLISAGLADGNGLTGDAEAILEPARTVDSRIAIRVVSPRRPPRRAQCADLALAASFGRHAHRG